MSRWGRGSDGVSRGYGAAFHNRSASDPALEDDTDVSEQTFLITGGANGVGRYLVEDLIGDSRHVFVFDRDADGLTSLLAEHSDMTCLECDLTSFEAVHEAVQRVYDAPSGPSVVVNNAGLIHSEVLVNLLSHNGPLHSVESWHRTLDANLTSVFYVAACVVERMVRARTSGLIINISSISAHGNAGQSAYSAAKAGVNALTVTWSKELAPLGIRTAAIAPGFLDTPSTTASLTEQQVEHWRRSTPLRRLGRPEEVASAVRFIVENDFYNGRVLELDGGLRM